jgi:tRNA modification GTPase
VSDTVFARATAPGRAAIAVVRVSGPDAAGACRALTGRPPPEPRRAVLRTLADAGGAIDRGLVLWFPGPASLTGEDVLELQVHGGRAVTEALLEALGRVPGLRPAAPGDLTRRAFVNGKLDLTAAEAVADLVDAETRAQARQALGQLGGELARLYDAWREQLLGALALIEAEIDFAAEEEVPDGLMARVRPTVEELLRSIDAHLADDRGERLREGLVVAVVGPPNAGKSSLVNRLARREVAIVAERPGTTRDVLEAHLDLGGLPVTVLDTAGLRAAAVDPVEREGIRRARARAESADLRLVVLDGAAWPPDTVALRGDSLLVANKADLGRVPAHPRIDGVPALAISCATGAGLGELLDTLADWAADRAAPEGPAPTRARHRSALEETRAALARVRDAPELALAAEDLRLAARGLGRITGRVGVEEVLDRIFAGFCIGK